MLLNLKVKLSTKNDGIFTSEVVFKQTIMF